MTCELVGRDLVFGYEPRRRVVDGVSVALAPGRVCGIVGPNGSGKSTLLRLLAGILEPESGQVTLDGRPLSRIGRLELARTVAFLPQSVVPTFNMTVWEVVAQGRFPHTGLFGFMSRRDEDVVGRCLERTESADLAQRKFEALSGGERQRVLVSSILAQEPRVILLDEPTAALDIHHQTEVLDLLWALSRDGLSVAIVTHDLNLAAQFCDALVLLDGGHVAASGTPDEVLRRETLERTYRSELMVTRNPVCDIPMVVVGRRRGRTGREGSKP